MRICLVLLVWLSAVRLCGCSVRYVGLNCLFFCCYFVLRSACVDCGSGGLFGCGLVC